MWTFHVKRAPYAACFEGAAISTLFDMACNPTPHGDLRNVASIDVAREQSRRRRTGALPRSPLDGEKLANGASAALAAAVPDDAAPRLVGSQCDDTYRAGRHASSLCWHLQVFVARPLDLRVGAERLSAAPPIICSRIGKHPARPM